MGRYDRFSKHPHRLQGYDYRWEGLYFITICTKDRFPFFGQVIDGEMRLSSMGIIVRDRWFQIPDHHPQVFLGSFVVMPNHVHGILGIEISTKTPAPVASMPCIDVEADSSSHNSKNQLMANLSPKSGSISRIIGSYKSGCSRQINQEFDKQNKHYSVPFSWQPRFHDHIIRNQQELEKIEHYILTNPQNWFADKFCLL